MTDHADTDPSLEPVKERDAAARNDMLIKAIKTLTVMLAVFTVTVVVTFGFAYIEDQQQQQESRSARDALIDTTNRIKDCTDPKGKCYRDGQARTGDAIASINAAQIAAIACSQELTARTAAEAVARNAAIAACVRKVLTTPPPR